VADGSPRTVFHRWGHTEPRGDRPPAPRAHSGRLGGVLQNTPAGYTPICAPPIRDGTGPWPCNAVARGRDRATRPSSRIYTRAGDFEPTTARLANSHHQAQEQRCSLATTLPIVKSRRPHYPTSRPVQTVYYKLMRTTNEKEAKTLKTPPESRARSATLGMTNVSGVLSRIDGEEPLDNDTSGRRRVPSSSP
jgi:hypothetical protein